MADTAEFFGSILPKKLQEFPNLAKDINNTYQFDIDGAGDWAVDLTDGGKVTEGKLDSPGCVVTVAKDDFEKLLANPASGMMLFTMGKLKVSNVALALSLQKLLG